MRARSPVKTSQFKTLQIVIGLLISISVCHSATNDHPHATSSNKITRSELVAAPKAALKVYRNENGEIIEQPMNNTPDIHPAAARQINTSPAPSPVIMRNPHPDGGWMMILDDRLGAKQTLDRKGKVHCHIEKSSSGSVNHRFSVNAPKAISTPK